MDLRTSTHTMAPAWEEVFDPVIEHGRGAVKRGMIGFEERMRSEGGDEVKSGRNADIDVEIDEHRSERTPARREEGSAKEG